MSQSSSTNPSDSGSGRFFLGCAVWAFRGWLGDFYPTGSRSGEFLKLYAERLTAVEGNTTFYSTPTEEMVSRWADLTPASFRFCPKLPRNITHRERLVPRGDAALAFIDRMQGLGNRLGPLFAQLPPSYGPEQIADLAAFLSHWPIKVPLAVEVRHPDWFAAPHSRNLNRLLAQHKVGRVLLDTRPIYSGVDDPQATSPRRKPKVPLQPTVTHSFAFVRYISHPDSRRNERYWTEWCDRVKEWLDRGTDVYFFVHCPQEVHSPRFAKAIQYRLENKGTALPPLPWDTVESTATEAQLSLF
ncbi:MAG: DUF72 domain-containing protein [Synechococcus sp.]